MLVTLIKGYDSSVVLFIQTFYEVLERIRLRKRPFFIEISTKSHSLHNIPHPLLTKILISKFEVYNLIISQDHLYEK